MRTLIHISDLHFGRTEAVLEDALRKLIGQERPDMVIVSGDITQRATMLQFQEAETFFASLPFPLFIVPGNHDVPLYSFWKRFYRPYKGYKMHISEDLEPEYQDDALAIIGLNTVRVYRMKEGQINQYQIERVHRMFKKLPSHLVKIVVSHHPFNIPETHYKRPLSQVRRFWAGLQETGIDMFLSGHLHDTLTRYEDIAYKLPIKTEGPLIIQAGTAISTRRRKEGNAFNIIRIERPHIAIERYASEKGESVFTLVKTEHFIQKEKGWVREKLAP